MSEPFPRTPGEFSDTPNIDPHLLDPQVLFTQYLDAAAGIPAGNRAEHLTDFAISLRDIDPKAYEHTMTLAKDALRQAWAYPETAETFGGPQGIADHMARVTLDEELITQASVEIKEELYVKLAVKHRDPTIVPDNQKSRDDYFHDAAISHGDAESIPEIVDPTIRALAYKEIFGVLDVETYGPAEWLALEEEAWHSITTMPVDKHGRHKEHIAAFAADHGAAFIERITDPEVQHLAFKKFIQKVKVGDEHAFDREWIKQKLVHELPGIRPGDVVELQRMVDTVAWAADHFADPEFAEYIIPETLFDSKPPVLANARKQKALRNLDGRAALELPLDNREFKGRDYVLSHIASETLDLDLANKIPDEFYRQLAYSVIAGKTGDMELKERVASYALEGPEPEDDSVENFGVGHFIANLNDPALSQRLLITPNITSATIARVARDTNDIELAAAIPNAWMRGSVVAEIASRLLRPDLLDMPGIDINPTMRANALRTIHRRVTGTVPVE